jgi:hypothetical protein
MTCPRCQQETPSDADFRPECGAKPAIVCANCRTGNASGSSRRGRSTPAFPPDPQELRARKVGHVVANSTVDRPWSQYFCCMATGHRAFVRKHPIATKRALRAILKAANIWGLEPERAARAFVDGGFTPRYDYALETVKNVPYTSGASTIRKTPFASMPFVSARRE